jgi:hypothetical protein
MLKTTVFLDVPLCNWEDIYRHFGGYCCPILYPEDAAHSSRTLVTIYQTTQHHNPENGNRTEPHDKQKPCTTLDLINTLLTTLTHSIA